MVDSLILEVHRGTIIKTLQKYSQRKNLIDSPSISLGITPLT
jgi:hypothetical protein